MFNGLPDSLPFRSHACAGREQVSGLVEQAISGKSMGSLIYQPSGCGEQNMIHMTLPLIATTYLDKTNQWEAVGFQKRPEGLKHIKTGKPAKKEPGHLNTEEVNLKKSSTKVLSG